MPRAKFEPMILIFESVKDFVITAIGAMYFVFLFIVCR
jgi:hypothetical protein